MNRWPSRSMLHATTAAIVCALFAHPALANPAQADDLAKSIVRLMDQYLPQFGVTLITDEICDLVSETALLQAAKALPELDPQTWTAGVGHPLAPLGSLRARFTRDAQFLRNQYLLIYVSDQQDYCEAKIENVSGF